MNMMEIQLQNFHLSLLIFETVVVDFFISLARRMCIENFPTCDDHINNHAQNPWSVQSVDVQ